MRVLLQRVAKASVSVDGVVIGSIERGVLLFVGVAHGDSSSDADWLAKKIAGLRIFEDAAGKMNLALNDVGGAALVVSQFTLYGDCRKGRRPGFDAAAEPEKANELYEYFIAALRREGVTKVETGRFAADMKVALVNDGPVTFLLERPFENGGGER